MTRPAAKRQGKPQPKPFFRVELFQHELCRLRDRGTERHVCGDLAEHAGPHHCPCGETWYWA